MPISILSDVTGGWLYTGLHNTNSRDPLSPRVQPIFHPACHSRTQSISHQFGYKDTTMALSSIVSYLLYLVSYICCSRQAFGISTTAELWSQDKLLLPLQQTTVKVMRQILCQVFQLPCSDTAPKTLRQKSFWAFAAKVTCWNTAGQRWAVHQYCPKIEQCYNYSL